MIEFSLCWMRRYLFDAVGAGEADYVLFGSTVLYMHGIRAGNQIGDVDVFVRRDIWARLFERVIRNGATIETPRAGDPPFLAYDLSVPIHVFYDWTARDRDWMTAGECFARARVLRFPLQGHVVGGDYLNWSCIPLELLREHKVLAEQANPGSEKHAKHQRDAVLIEAHLERERIR